MMLAMTTDELRDEFAAIRDNVATKSDLREMEQRIDLKFAAIGTRLEKLLRLSLGVIGVVAAGVGVLFGMLHLWLPH